MPLRVLHGAVPSSGSSDEQDGKRLYLGGCVLETLLPEHYCVWVGCLSHEEGRSVSEFQSLCKYDNFKGYWLDEDLRHPF